MYRIAQEALQNVMKHAGAAAVTVSLAQTDTAVRLVIHDDGGGFDQDAAEPADGRQSYGLVGMGERAELIGARLEVTSAIGDGTTVEVVLRRPDVTSSAASSSRLA